MLKDFPRSLQIVTYAVKVTISHKECKIVTLQLQTTDRNNYVLSNNAISNDVYDLQIHSDFYRRVSIFRTLLQQLNTAIDARSVCNS